MSDRDELTQDVIDGSKRMHVNTSYGLQEAIADHLRHLGYRKPRTVTTAAELDALPEGSALMEANGGRYWLKTDEDFWEGIHSAFADSASLELYGPLTVLHEGAR